MSQTRRQTRRAEASGGIAARLAVRRRRRTSLGLNTAAMIDVTFLLLVYFMAATEFTKVEETYGLEVPAGEAAGPADPFDLAPPPLRVIVISTGPGPEDCTVRLDGPYPPPETLDGLLEFLRSRRVGGGSQALFEPDHPILVDPDPEARWEHALEAFSIAVRAGYHRVTLAADDAGAEAGP